jgi:hypothetical protein
VEIVVDNRGGDAGFAAELAEALRERGFDVTVRVPRPASMFDTAVHVVASPIALRVPNRPDAARLGEIERAVRAALPHRPSVRRQTQSVPVYLGDSARVVKWIDTFD